MDTRLEALAGFVLDGLIEENLSDATAYEFAEQSCICIREGAEILWGNQLEKLWDYLASERTMSNRDEQDRSSVFRQGRIYATMELLKMLQQQQEDENTLEEDAKEYCGHWRIVFEALQDGRSMTHRELARAVSVSESSLSQFLHRIERKNYIHFRKVGRTKYYRLSGRGRKLLQRMPLRKKAEWDYGLCVRRCLDFERKTDQFREYSMLYQYFVSQKDMVFRESYHLPDTCSTKRNVEAKEDMYMCV